MSLISLLKGIVFNHQRETWDNLLQYEPDVKKYFSAVGLEVYIDKSEGYAYLSQKQWEDESAALPRLAERRQLNFHTSLLCIVLRKYLLEQGAQGHRYLPPPSEPSPSKPAAPPAPVRRGAALAT